MSPSRRRAFATLAVAVCVWGWGAPSSAEESTDPAAGSGTGKRSLIEIAPELYYTAKRYDKFFGDSNTRHGELLARSYLLGDPGGVRRWLVDHGVFVDAGVTQFVQGNVTGGDDSSSNPRFAGSADLWLWLDSGKAGFWPGGAVFVHAEGRWRGKINSDVGSLQPSNFDASMPSARGAGASDWAVSEWYLLQALPGNLLAAVGKIDMSAWADTNMFANRERSQFVYTGLISNAIPGVFFPYTSQGAWLSWSPTKAHNLTAVYSATDDTATQVGFDKVLNGNNSYAVQYIYATEVAARPGRYLLAAVYTTRDVTGFTVSQRFGRSIGISDLEDVVVGVPVLDEESHNYGVVGNFAQYLWVDDESTEAFRERQAGNRHAALSHHNVPPVGIGVFGRVGWSPKDRNTIDQFYSFGIGGYGMLIPGREDDQWGIGWAGSHISDDLRDVSSSLRSWEHAGELFYNFSLTPAVHLTLSSQIIRPAIRSNDTAVTLGARLQLDF